MKICMYRDFVIKILRVHHVVIFSLTLLLLVLLNTNPSNTL